MKTRSHWDKHTSFHPQAPCSIQMFTRTTMTSSSRESKYRISCTCPVNSTTSKELVVRCALKVQRLFPWAQSNSESNKHSYSSNKCKWTSWISSSNRMALEGGCSQTIVVEEVSPNNTVNRSLTRNRWRQAKEVTVLGSRTWLQPISILKPTWSLGRRVASEDLALRVAKIKPIFKRSKVLAESRQVLADPHWVQRPQVTLTWKLTSWGQEWFSRSGSVYTTMWWDSAWLQTNWKMRILGSKLSYTW